MDINIYTEEILRPVTVDILTAAFESCGVDVSATQYSGVRMAEDPNGNKLDPMKPTLILGRLPTHVPYTHVKTLSQKQLVANPAAMTELQAAIQLLVRQREVRPFSYRIVEGHESGIKELTSFDMVTVVDIETGGDVKTWQPEDMWLLSLAITDGKKIVVFSEEWLQQDKNKELLRRFFQNPKRKFIAHNMKFDFRSLSALLGITIYGHLCTLLLHHAFNPGAKEHGLKETCQKYLGAPDWDSGAKAYVGGKYKVADFKNLFEAQPNYSRTMYDQYVERGTRPARGYENIPKHILYEYNAYDVYWTWDLYLYLSEIADERAWGVALHEFRMSVFFQDIESRGIQLDVPVAESLSIPLHEEKNILLSDLEGMVWEGFNAKNAPSNPGSWQQVQKYLHNYGAMVKKTDEETLMDYLADNPDAPMEVEMFIERLLDYRGVSKKLSTYVDGVLEKSKGGRAFPSYLVHGTNTGRMSTKSPAIQTIPRPEENGYNLREMYTHREGERTFLEVDYSQAELRTMAVLSQDDYLISLFQPGMPDFFDSLMPEMYPHIADWDLVTKADRKNMRANLKGVIYGLSYGRKARAIAKALGISPKEAQGIINNYFRVAPQFAEWRKEVEYLALSSDGVLETVFGRRFQSEVVTGRTKQSVVNSALAFLPQSTASDICVTAAMEIHKWIHEYDAEIVGSIHDAILIDVPTKHVREVAARVQEEMAASAVAKFGTQVPFATEAEWGSSWGTAKPQD